MIPMLDDWVSYLTVERNLSENTVLAYERDVSGYLKFVEAESPRDLEKLRVSDVTRYMKNLH